MVPSSSLSPDCDTIQYGVNRDDGEGYPVNSIIISGVENPALRVVGIACSQGNILWTNCILLVRDCNAFFLGWDVDTT